MIPRYGHTTGIMRLFYYTGRMLSIQMDWEKCTKKFEFFLNEKIRSGMSRKPLTLRIVGATLGRPPKNYVFRISRREKTEFRLAAMDFALQNPRATEGRPYGWLSEKQKNPVRRKPDRMGDAYLREASRASIFLMGSMMEPTLISWLMAATK